MSDNRINKNQPVGDELHEECGVFGMYDFDGGDVASTIYYGLFALQHRGQESCGIAVSETNGPKGKVTSYKGMGLVNEVFTEENLEPMHGDIGVGHVRYSTAGASTRENAQPLVLNYVKGTLALAHNGNLINAAELRHDLEYTGAIFQTTIDCLPYCKGAPEIQYGGGSGGTRLSQDQGSVFPCGHEPEKAGRSKGS